MKRVVTATLCLWLGAVAHSEIVRVDIEGHLDRTITFNMSLPADGPQVGDHLSLHFTYDTALFDYYSGTSSYGGEWDAFYSGPAVLDFDLTVTRDSQTTFEIINFEPYHADIMSIYNAFSSTNNVVMQGVSFSMRDRLTEVYPAWYSSITLKLISNSPGYQDLFAPSNVIDPACYSTQELEIMNGYWRGRGAAEKSYNYTFTFDSMDVQIIPEPATVALLGFGAIAILRKRR